MTNARFIRQELCFILTLVLFIRGHQGFFVKHSSSGLCLQSASQYRMKGGSVWGPVYVAHFYNTCLHPDAQFRFFQPFSGDSVLFNIGKNGTFLARGNLREYNNRFHIYHAPPGSGAYTNFIFTNQFGLKQTKAGALKLQVGYCPTPREPSDTSSGAIIPQNGDTVYQNTNCDKEEQKFIFGQVTKEGKNMTDAHCSPSQVMEVVMAEYGGFSDGKIFNYTNDADCSLPSANIVKSQCDGKISCNMSVNSSLFKNDPCPGKDKQLYMEYVCVDSLSTPITKASKVRLSELPNEGFIEIFDGSKWRKVDDKNWDKRKQTPLCQHLGYSDTKSNNTLKEISSGEIATGYLYCSGQQPSTQACSVYLYPSTLTNKATKIPYGKCTLCDEPLLQNSTKFPDTIFSASDSNGYEARLSNSGWCPKSSGTQYLQIDLQRDFFISHIATFGDKEQTKWATSYDLQYSSTSGKLGSSAKRTITSTHDAYGASVTALNIVYARFLKITVQNGNTVCIRVQLCGHVLPDAVKQLTVSGKTAITADISWTLPEYERHVGITYFLISLNDSSPSINVTRQSGNYYQHQLKNLKPYTNYKVTVQAGNAYGPGSITSETFRTDQAAPSGPPLNVKVTTQSSSSLFISWKAPEVERQNGVITNFTVCLSHHKDGVCFKEYVTKNYELSINNLSFSTKYVLRVLATTRAGSGIYSQSQEAFTNGRPLSNLVYRTPNTLLFLSQIPKENVSYYEVIAVYLSQNTAPIKSPSTYSRLSRFSEAKKSSQSIPYIAAVFNINDGRFQVFTLGDGMNYSKPRTKGDTSEAEIYFNVPLKENGTYRVFQRFFKNKNDYYYSDWSPPAVTTTKQLCGEKAAAESCKECSKASLFVGIAVSLVLNAVLIIFIIYQNVCRDRTKSAKNNDIGTKVDNKAFSDDIYDDETLPNNETPSTYEELNLNEIGRDEHTYQSLEKKATA